jgi:large subunit ribosomal protein L19
MNDLLKKIEKLSLTDRVDNYEPGDTVLVEMRILEGDKERVQPFQGVLIQKRGTGMSKSLTVRKASGNVYVERIFPLHSPLISEIKVIRRGHTRRAKLYYLRNRTGKSTRIEEEK